LIGGWAPPIALPLFCPPTGAEIKQDSKRLMRLACRVLRHDHRSAERPIERIDESRKSGGRERGGRERGGRELGERERR